MDKLYQYKEQGFLTDGVIEIRSPDLHTEINVHLNIICAMCPYFERMLSHQTIESLTKKIIMDFPYGHVFVDIINSFYGKKTNTGNLSRQTHLLQTIIVEDYLSLPLSETQKKDLLFEQFNSDHRELLLNVADVFYHHNFFGLVMHRHGLSYQLESSMVYHIFHILFIFDNSFVYHSLYLEDNEFHTFDILAEDTMKFIGYSDTHLYSVDGDSIIARDLITREITQTPKRFGITSCYISSDNQYVAYYHDNVVHVYTNGQLIMEIKSDYQLINNVIFSENNLMAIYEKANNICVISIWDLSKKICEKSNIPETIKVIKFFPGSDKIIVATDEYMIIVHHRESYTSWRRYTHLYAGYGAYDICFDQIGERIIVSHGIGVYVVSYDLEILKYFEFNKMLFKIVLLYNRLYIFDGDNSKILNIDTGDIIPFIDPIGGKHHMIDHIFTTSVK